MGKKVGWMDHTERENEIEVNKGGKECRKKERKEK